MISNEKDEAMQKIAPVLLITITKWRAIAYIFLSRCYLISGFIKKIHYFLFVTRAIKWTRKKNQRAIKYNFERIEKSDEEILSFLDKKEKNKHKYPLFWFHLLINLYFVFVQSWIGSDCVKRPLRILPY